MAIIETQTIETINNQDIDQLSSKTLIRSFGQSNDFIELTIFDQNGKVLLIDEFFNDYTPYYDTPGTTNNKTKITSIDIDFEQVLQDYGYSIGTYIMNFSFQRRILTKGIKKLFYISEISPSRREIRIKSDTLKNSEFTKAINELTRALNQSNYIKDINLAVDGGNTLLAINSLLNNDNTGLIKLYNPLPGNIGINSRFRVFEEVINPLEVTVQINNTTIGTDVGIDIGSPNFTLSTEDIFTVPSGYKTFDQILANGTVSSSFNNIQGLLSGSNVQIDLEFDNTDTPSGYHFENFIHFSSATERLQNFKYKLGLLESYSSSIAQLNNITGSVSSSNFIIENKNILHSKENKLLQSFDYYERYLYYENGPYAWPKINNTLPYINAKVDSPSANSWFGVPIDNYGTYNGGQMVSASNFDDCNIYNLTNTIPPHIKDNPQNDKYILFVEMIAQHFDGIWAYMDSITDINEAYSGLKDGISKDLVLNQLTSRGISAYDQFSNASLYEYLIGDDGTETFKYNPTDGSTLISASNTPIPKGDIAKEIWKRLYHNSSYLLKTKGTERGLKALIACYGIPETILHIKEYGGPLVDKTGFRTFTYQKESRMVDIDGLSGANKGLASLRDPLSGSSEIIRTIQIRAIPTASLGAERIPIFGIHDGTSVGTDFVLFVSKSNNELIGPESGSFGRLVMLTGSVHSDDYNNSVVATSSLLPLFNGKPWNFTLTIDSGSTDNITAYATQTTFNKNIFKTTLELQASNVLETSNDHDIIFIPYDTVNGVFGLANFAYNKTKAHEARAYTELLSEDTIISQSFSPFNYNGNTVSSSYETLKYRFPLGSDLGEVEENFSTNVAATNTKYNKIPKNISEFNYNSRNASLNISKTHSIEETHHLTTPDTVGSGMVSDKVRIDNGTFDDNFLDPFISVETSPQDRQPLDYSDLGVFFSPTFEVNEDIIYTLGGFRLDDYIGDPTHYTSGSYPDLKDIRDIYTQKLNKKLGIGDYIRTIQFFDHTLFKMIKEFTPAKANLKTGLVIEPHYLERTKIPGTNIDYEHKTVHLISPTGLTGSLSAVNETEYDVFIDVVDYIESGSYGNAIENVAQTGKTSRFYSLR